MRPILLLISIAVLILATLPVTDAFGVTPGRQTYDYAQTLNGAFTIINSDGSDVQLSIIARGELAPHITFSESSIEMLSTDLQRRITYTIRPPTDLEPGEHTLDIYVLALRSDQVGSNVVGAATGIVTQAIIKVPYPGKFVRSRIDHDRTTNTVHIPVFGLGEERIQDLTVDLVMYGPTNEVVSTHRSESRSLDPKAYQEYSFPLTVQPGSYLARATVTYDGKTLIIERTVSIGAAQAIIHGISVPDYYYGSISKLVIHAKSEWNEPITTTAFVEFIAPDGSFIERVRSAETTIPPYARADIDIFWDSANYAPGDYRITAKLTIGEEVIERSFPLTMTPTSIRIGTAGAVVAGGGNTALIVLVVLVLIVLNAILLFVLFKDRIKKKPRKTK